MVRHREVARGRPAGRKGERVRGATSGLDPGRGVVSWEGWSLRPARGALPGGGAEQASGTGMVASWVPAGHRGRERRGDRGAVLGEGPSSQRATLQDESLGAPASVTWAPDRVGAGGSAG